MYACFKQSYFVRRLNTKRKTLFGPICRAHNPAQVVSFLIFTDLRNLQFCHYHFLLPEIPKLFPSPSPSSSSLQASSLAAMEMNSLPNGNSTPCSAPVPTTANPASSKLNQLAESLRLEHQFLRVPFEHYKKTIRANHRVVEKEISAVVSGVSDAADRDDLSRDDAVSHLNSLVSRLQGLKRKVSQLLSPRCPPFQFTCFFFLKFLLRKFGGKEMWTRY